MIYAEFIDRDRQMPVEIFRHQSLQDNWNQGEDVKTINIGRHKGIGPRPAYLCCWRIAGLARMDAWEGLFKSPAGRRDTAEHATALALDFRCCGLYDELVAGELPDGNLHYMERFDGGAEAGDGALVAHFEERVRFERFGNEGFDFEIGQRQQLDRLLELRRHHQRLGLPDIAARPQRHELDPRDSGHHRVKLSPR